jgi:hypothetical protein
MQILSTRNPWPPAGPFIPGPNVVAPYLPVRVEAASPTGEELICLPYFVGAGIPVPPVVDESMCAVAQLSPQTATGEPVTGIRIALQPWRMGFPPPPAPPPGVLPALPITGLDLQLLVINQLTGLPSGSVIVGGLQYGDVVVSYDVRGGDLITFMAWVGGAAFGIPVVLEVTEI